MVVQCKNIPRVELECLIKILHGTFVIALFLVGVAPSYVGFGGPRGGVQFNRPIVVGDGVAVFTFEIVDQTS